jgi:hypothetical protein
MMAFGMELCPDCPDVRSKEFQDNNFKEVKIFNSLITYRFGVQITYGRPKVRC